MQELEKNNDSDSGICVCGNTVINQPLNINQYPQTEIPLVDKEIDRLLGLLRENPYLRQAVSSMLQSRNQSLDVNFKVRGRRLYGFFYTLGGYSE
jgi:hypothetical protein